MMTAIGDWVVMTVHVGGVAMTVYVGCVVITVYRVVLDDCI